MKNVREESIILSTRRAAEIMFAWLASLVHVFRRGGEGRVPRCCACGIRAADEHYTRLGWRRHACRACWRELVRVGDARAVRAVRANLAGISSRHALALARLEGADRHGGLAQPLPGDDDGGEEEFHEL